MPDTDAPVIVSFGGGVDSTALLVEMVRLGERVDRVFFADTGAELPGTYRHVALVSRWLVDRGYPPVEIVRYEPVRAPYRTLEGNCLANRTLPSLAYGRRGCSAKFKHRPMDEEIKGISRGPRRRPPSPEWVRAQQAGVKIWRLIGYNADEVRRGRGRRRGKLIEADRDFRYRYPLVDWGWGRRRCTDAILEAGLPVRKSACFFCPASREWELLLLAAEHPDLFLRAITIEDNARAGKHGIGPVGGLGGYAGPADLRSWRRWAERAGILKGNQIVAEADWLRSRARELMTPDDSGPALVGGCYRQAAGG